MSPVRCPQCSRLLGYFKGEGELVCPRCRRGAMVYFNTNEQLIEMKKRQ